MSSSFMLRYIGGGSLSSLSNSSQPSHAAGTSFSRCSGRYCLGLIRAVLAIGAVVSGIEVPARLQAATVVDFSTLDTPQSNAFGQFHAGPTLSGLFVERGVKFSNLFEDFGTFSVWSGWAISQSGDRTTASFENQYSAWPGGGTNSGAGQGGEGSPGNSFGVAFVTTDFPARIALPTPSQVTGFHLTNTTYAALSMQQGDAFAKKFGGPSGSDPDFFELTVMGWDLDGQATGQVAVALADFRSDDSQQDFILDHWKWLDLTSLGAKVSALTFQMNSSDVGMFGINTPTYFALDNLTLAAVPEPSLSLAYGLASVGGLLTMGRRSNRPTDR